MSKINLGQVNPTIALPVCLLGSKIKGEANFCTVAWFTMIDDEPPTIGLLLGKKRTTVDGVKENGAFSVNIPSRRMTASTDYCGITSGYKTDKSQVFSVSYGELRSAPLIDECPLSMECRLKQIIVLEGTDLLIGEIVHVHVEEGCLTGGKPDLTKIDPLLYGMGGGPYFALGDRLEQAFKVGKTFKKK